MTIEINNESGVEVDEAALATARPLRARRDARSTRSPSCRSLLVDADAMAALHEQWMDLPGPTDVMAFPMDAADGPLERLDPSAPPRHRRGAGPRPCSATSCCARRSPPTRRHRPGHSTESELHLLCTHGILHLLGYDHGDADEEREMFELQARSCSPSGHGRDRRASRSGRRCPAPAARSATRRVAAVADPERAVTLPREHRRRRRARRRDLPGAARRPARRASTPRSARVSRGAGRGVRARGPQGREGAAGGRRRPRPLHEPAAAAAGDLRADRDGARHDRRARRSSARDWPVTVLTVRRDGRGLLRARSASGRARSAASTRTAVALAGARLRCGCSAGSSARWRRC